MATDTYTTQRDVTVSLVRVTRSTALKRGSERLQEAARFARRLRSDCQSIAEQIAPLGTFFSDARDAENRLAAFHANLQAAASAVADLEGQIDQLLTIPGAAAELGPDDKRKAMDKRRFHVVRSCCYIWSDAGRQITYTSRDVDDKQKRRSGPLIDFIQTVIGLVTDPSSEVPVETLRHDLDVFAKEQAAPDPMTTPPEREQKNWTQSSDD